MPLDRGFQSSARLSWRCNQFSQLCDGLRREGEALLFEAGDARFGNRDDFIEHPVISEKFIKESAEVFFVERHPVLPVSSSESQTAFVQVGSVEKGGVFLRRERRQ